MNKLELQRKYIALVNVVLTEGDIQLHDGDEASLVMDCIRMYSEGKSDAYILGELRRILGVKR